MDKQKQIEEMAKVVCGGGHIDYERCGDCFGEEDGFCGCIGLVERLYNAGYRKIPENNAVVLTDKNDIQQYEWSKLVDKMGVIEFGEKVRKETAEKFAERLKEELENRSAIDGYDLEDLEFDGEIIQECIDEILKEITEGEKEISNETV